MLSRETPADPTAQLAEALRAAMKENERLRRQNRRLAAGRAEPIAVVAMGCRLPGGVASPDDLWELVAQGRDAVGPYPADRGWDPAEIAEGPTREGGFLHGVADFDPELFGIGPAEALAMDPQQRLLLEITWEAFERAGLDPTGLRGSRTGVFMGTNGQEYAGVLEAAGEGGTAHAGTGNAASIVSGRLSYTFGLGGPSVTVDTACSSSLVAIHLAVKALRAGECALALAGGVTVMSRPTAFVLYGRQGAVSPSGRCKAFGDGADGVGWGEGAGVVLLERLADARRNGHPVLAVLRGSAVNSDGASNGITAPSGPAQQRVVRAALADAGLTPSDVDVVEAHGTGTPLGDPIEAQALLATYGQGRDRPLLLGSVKSNIGHTQAAAGVAGVIKAVMALRHRKVPATLHADTPTPHVDWSIGAVEPVRAAVPWPRANRPGRAAVSSFGVSGTNAHVIVEAANDPEPVTGEPAPSAPLVVSGHTAAALRAQAAALVGRPGRQADIAYTLAGRAKLAHRAVVLDPADLLALADGREAPGVVTGTAEPGGPVVFAFPGQGAQWAGMGARLLVESRVFASRIAECEDALAPHVDWSLSAVLCGAPGAPGLDRVDVVQPASFAVMVALAALWRAHGVEPAAVVGHSQGEVAAACVAGALSLADAAAVVALRSRAIAATLSGRGGMLSAALPAAALEPRLRPGVSVAALNGPASTVVAGEVAALDALAAELAAEGVRVRRLPVDYASHSAHVDALRDDLLTALADIRPVASDIPFFSTVAADWLDTTALDAGYWFANLRGTVRFAEAVRALVEQGHRVFVEVSAHPVLVPAVEATEAAGPVVAVGSLRRDHGGLDRFHRCLAEAFAVGVPVDWSAPFAGTDAALVDLPTYRFQRTRHWPTAAPAGLFHRPEWTEVVVGGEVTDAEQAGAEKPGGPWLVVGGDLAPGVVAALGGAVVVDGHRDGLAERVGAAVAETTPRGVLSLLALDETDADGCPAGVLATAELIRALDGVTAPLWCATRGAVSVEGEPVSPAQAAVWGLGRVAAVEHPDRWGGLVDLPPELDGAAAARVTAVLTGGEDQVAVRSSGVVARRLRPMPAPAGGAPDLTGTVLVTGTGAVAIRVARWAVARGATRLLLLDDAPGPVPDLGVPVDSVPCDLADPAAVAAAVAGTPLSGVVHTASPAGDAALSTLTGPALARAVRTSVAGLRALREATAGRPLAAFVVFTSFAGVVGGPGQAARAAADAAADALVLSLDGARSVAWGVWDTGDGPDLTARGLPPLDPDTAVGVLDSVPGGADPTVVVAPVAWDRFAGWFTASRPSPLIAELTASRPRPSTAPADPGFADRLSALPRAEADRALLTIVRETAAAVLGHADPAAVGTRRGFTDLGFDSLTGVELRNRLAAATGVRLPATAVFDHPNPDALAGHIAGLLLGAQAPAAATSTPVDAADPVAIVGMACRYPGGVESPEDLWRLVDEGRDAVTGFPTDRGWDLRALAGLSAALEGGFLADVASFDPGFFGISPNEAIAMDPQQRLLLEAAWEVLERAGIDAAALRGSATGVFVGAVGTDYRPPAAVRGHHLAGGVASVLSGRVAYALGLEGPAVTVDTACSSSLVAMHLAAQALRAGECALALAGGVMVMSSPDAFTGFTAQGGLAPSGRCKSFAEGADGTGWSEGVGLLVLERLSDARRNGHDVLAVLRGSAVNSDGASAGLTAPSGPAQQRVIRAALSAAGLAPSDVDVVEAHGTGTALGDPIEAQALLATYGQDRDRPLLLGSIKSNIAHAQAAAGVAGVIKMVEAMRRGRVPATLHAERPSTRVDWASGSVELVTAGVDWPDNGRPRRAGVSSFGASGTNAHVIVEQAAEAPEPARTAVPGPVPVVLSARDPDALREQARHWAGALNGDLLDGDLLDIAYSSAVTRAHLDHRAAVVAADRAALAAGLAALAAGDPGALTGRGDEPPVIGAVFAGQGAQRVGMGAGLAARFPVFATAFAAVADRLHALGCPVRSAVADDRVHETGFTQPALFAVEVALFRLLESWGLRPEVLVGHSVGEIAAAHVAGVLSLDDACLLVVERARLMRALPPGGAMAAVRAPEAVVVPLLAPGAVIAAVNAPDAVVIAGPESAVDATGRRLAEAGRQVRPLRVSHAFHSPLVEPVLAGFRAAIAGISFGEARIPIVSTVTGEVAAMDGADYWVDQVRLPVRFADAVATAKARGATAFVEIGPDGGLCGAVAACADVLAVPLCRRDADEVETAAAAAARLHVAGAAVDWPAFHDGTGARRTALPTYRFRRERYWPARMDAGDVTAAGLDAACHPLLGATILLPDSGGMLLTGQLARHTHPWLDDHRVGDRVLFPATGYLELTVRAGDEVGCPRVHDLTIEQPLVLPAEGAAQVRVTVGPADAEDRRTVAVHSRIADGDWVRHASGLIAPAVDQARPAACAWPPPGSEPVPLDGFYDRLSAEGFHYGPVFRGLRAVWRDGDAVHAEVALPEAAADPGFVLHPALLDAAVHATAFAHPGGDPGRLPFAWHGVTLHAAGATRLRATLSWAGPDAISIELADATGAPVATVRKLVMRPAPAIEATTAPREALHTVRWRPADLPEPLPDGPGPADELTTVVHATGEGAAERVLRAIQDWTAREDRAGARLVVVTRGAVAAAPGDTLLDLAAAPVWGLVRAAQWEEPGRLLLVDLDPDGSDPDREDSPCEGSPCEDPACEDPDGVAIGRAGCGGTDPGGDLRRALATGEPQAAVRRGEVLVPRLVRAVQGDTVSVPDGIGTDTAWRLAATGTGSVDGLVAEPVEPAALRPGEVRLGIRAAGVNFRDVLATLGLAAGTAPGPLGVEGAGVVTEIGPGVADLAPGDRVMGVLAGAFGPTAIADRRTLAAVPADWTFADAATIPMAYLTAYHALVDITGVRPGDKVLVHAGAGGVGTAAVRLAQHLGATVYATASPAKWPALRALGVPADRIASSRTLDFADRFGRVDVVLNSLAGEFTDASLRMLGPGGRFAELGKSDVRDPAEVAAAHPGVVYRAFDTVEAGPDRIAAMLAELTMLIADGVVRPLPVTTWDIRQAPAALRHMRQAAHVGKVVLTVPAPWRPDGTVLITGGTGGLGAALARHLAARGATRFLLVGRRGPDAPGAAELVADLAALGASATVAACDVTDRAAIAAVLAAVPAEHPLTAVVHAAGVVDDAVLPTLTARRLAAVLAPKAGAALALHELTRTADLAVFAAYSSVVGTVGGPGQGAYAAANAALDALAQRRRALGLPSTSLAWGPWTADSGMTAALSAADVRRASRAGTLPIAPAEGLALFDAALAAGDTAPVPIRFDTAALRANPELPALLRELVTPSRRAAADRQATDRSFVDGLAAVGAAERKRALLRFVREQVAAVLGHGAADRIDPSRGFTDLGFDSLTAVELRNRLAAATGVRLATTAIFDHPTPSGLTAHLLDRLAPAFAPDDPLAELSALEAEWAGGLPEPVRAEAADRLRALLAAIDPAGRGEDGFIDAIDAASDDDIFEFIDRELRGS